MRPERIPCIPCKECVAVPRSLSVRLDVTAVRTGVHHPYGVTLLGSVMMSREMMRRWIWLVPS